MAAIVDISGGPFPAGASLTYTAQLVDQNGKAIPAASLTTLTLSVVDTQTSATINGVRQTNILNTDRGAIDAQGNLTITLLPADNAFAGTGLRQRSMIIDATYNGGLSTMRHQVNYWLAGLAGA
jgi:hypothetical protein